MAIFPTPDDFTINYTHLRNEHQRAAKVRQLTRVARSSAGSNDLRPSLPRLLRIRHSLAGVFSWQSTLAARSNPTMRTANSTPQDAKP